MNVRTAQVRSGKPITTSTVDDDDDDRDDVGSIWQQLKIGLMSVVFYFRRFSTSHSVYNSDLSARPRSALATNENSITSVIELIVCVCV